MAKVRSERDLVDNGIRALVDALGYSGAARFLRHFSKVMVITSRFKANSSKGCVWNRYTKRPASTIPASRADCPRQFNSAAEIFEFISTFREFPKRGSFLPESVLEL